MRAFRDFAQSNRWIWAALAVVILWVVLSSVSGRWSLSSLSGIVLSASFLTCVALGQMLVVTTGRGNIDLSVAGILTQSAFLALVVVQGQDGRIVLGVLAALGLGAGAGLVNAALVIWLRIPAIIATLATGYILASAALMTNAANFGPRTVAPGLRWLASGKVGGVPVFALVTFAVVLLVAVALRHTVFGRRLSAVGQNRAAARLAGVSVNAVLVAAFVASGVLAALTGLVLGAYVGGAFLEIGQPYLLQSVAAVVLGGTLITGGQGTAVGTWFAGILLILLVTIMQIQSLPRGTQDFVQGVVVILVLALAARRPARRGAAPAAPPAPSTSTT
jgi:ribose transport system permease protein